MRRPENTQTHKRCPECGETKPRTEFYGCKSRYDGLQSICKICMKRYSLASSRAERMGMKSPTKD